MHRTNTPFPPHCPLHLLHPCDVTQPAQQLPEPATLLWQENMEIWLLRVDVALAAILEHECCSRSPFAPAYKLSAKLYDIPFCVYSEKLLMTDRGTVRNM